MKTALDIPFTPDAAPLPDRRVTVEAETGPEGAASPTLTDIDAMIARARSGLSARTYQEDICPAAEADETGLIRVRLAVLVWPSLPDLEYRITLPEGATPGPTTIHRQARRHRIWTDGRPVHELPWRMEGGRASWHHELSPRNRRGDGVAAPRVTVEDARVVLSAPVYGLLTVTGTAVGYRHEFSMDFAKFADDGSPQRIAPDDAPVTAAWTGADGGEETEEIDVAMPACAAALLETCEEGRKGVFYRIVRKRREGYVEVAYSACDGSVLGTRQVGE